ncbi:MAG: translation elongation factor Ts [Actinomycetota bacterium]
MSIGPSDVKKLRELTGAGMMDCKRALEEADGDFEAAKDILKKKGMVDVEKRSGRAAKEGMVAVYMHQLDPDLPPKKGVLVELNCETDFVAKTPEFKQLGKDVAMHIAAMQPRWVSRDQMPPEIMEREKKILSESDAVAGKPPEIVEKIVEGKLKSVFSAPGGVLLDQVFVKDEKSKKTVGELIGEVAASMKENVVVSRFARFSVGEQE